MRHRKSVYLPKYCGVCILCLYSTDVLTLSCYDSVICDTIICEYYTNHDSLPMTSVCDNSCLMYTNSSAYKNSLWYDSILLYIVRDKLDHDINVYKSKSLNTIYIMILSNVKQCDMVYASQHETNIIPELYIGKVLCDNNMNICSLFCISLMCVSLILCNFILPNSMYNVQDYYYVDNSLYDDSCPVYLYELQCDLFYHIQYVDECDAVSYVAAGAVPTCRRQNILPHYGKHGVNDKEYKNSVCSHGAATPFGQCVILQIHNGKENNM